MAENIEEVIQEETIQNDITPVAETETIQTDIDATNGNQQTNVATNVTTNATTTNATTTNVKDKKTQGKTLEEQLEDVRKKQQEYRESYKKGLGELQKDKNYNKLVRQYKKIESSIIEAAGGGKDIKDQMSRPVVGDPKIDNVAVQIDQFKNTSDKNNTTVNQYSYSGPTLDNVNTYDTDAQSVYRTNQAYNESQGAFNNYKIPDVRSRKQQALVNTGLSLDAFQTAGDFLNLPDITRETFVTAEQQKVLYNIAPNGEITEGEDFKEYASDLFIQALGVDKKIDELSDEYNEYRAANPNSLLLHQEYRRDANKIIQDAIVAPENQAFINGLVDNQVNKLTSDFTNEVLNEAAEEYLNSIIPSYSFTSREDQVIGDKTFSKGDVISLSQYDLAKQAQSNNLTLDEFVEKLKTRWDVTINEASYEYGKIEASGKSATEDQVNVINNFYNHLDNTMNKWGEVALKKGVSYIMDREIDLPLYSESSSFIDKLQVEQDDIILTKDLSGNVIRRQARFDYRDVEKIQELARDQALYESLKDKENLTDNDKAVLTSLKGKYGEDLSIISQRRAELITFGTGIEFSEKTANLVFDPITGTLYRKGKENTVVDIETGDVLAMEDLSGKVEDYRMYLNQKYKGVDIDSQIVQYYLKIRSLATMLGEKGLKREPGELNLIKELIYSFEEAWGETGDDKVQSIFDPNSKLKLIKAGGYDMLLAAEGDILSKGNLSELYNSYVKELRHLSTFKMLNYSPLEQKKGGFGEGAGVGFQDFIYTTANTMPTSYEYAESFRRFAESQIKEDRDILLNQETYDKWFNADGSVKHEWDYGVGYQTPFWLRLTAEFALVEFTFGGAIASGTNLIGRLAEASYIEASALRAGGKLRSIGELKRFTKISNGSLLGEKAMGYINATSHEFQKLYFYNKTFGQVGEEMPYTYTILGPAGYAYSRYLSKLFGYGKPMIRSTSAEFSKLPYLHKLNILGRENIPYYRLMSSVVSEPIGAVSSASLLQIGTSFDAAVTQWQSKNNKEFNMNHFLDSFDIDHFTQNMALSLIMRGTSPNKLFSDLSMRYHMDVNSIMSKNWYKNAVRQAKKEFGIDITRKDFDMTGSEISTAIEKKLQEKLKDEAVKGKTKYKLLDELRDLGYKFDGINENSTKEQILESINNFKESLSDKDKLFMDGLTLGVNPNIIKDIGINYRKSQVLQYDVNFGVFEYQYNLQEDYSDRMNKAVNSILSNKTGDGVQLMRTLSTSNPELVKQLLIERGITDKNVLDIGVSLCEDALAYKKYLDKLDISMDSEAAAKIIQNAFKKPKLLTEKSQLEKETKELGINHDERIAEIDAEIEKIDKYLKEDFLADVNNEKQILANAARDRLINIASKTGQVIQFGSSETRVRQLMAEEGLTESQAKKRASNESLTTELNKLIEEGSIDINDPGLQEFRVKNEEGELTNTVKIPDGVIVDALVTKTLSTDKTKKVRTFFVDMNNKNISIDIHETSHPVLDVLMDRLNIKDYGGEKAAAFVTAFMNSLPRVEGLNLYEKISSRLSNELNINLNEPKTFEGKNLTEVFTRYLEEVDKLSVQDRKLLYSMQNIKGLESTKNMLEQLVKEEFGAEVDIELGVNFIQKLAEEMIQAKVENSIGPEGEFIEITEPESKVMATTEDGYITMSFSKMEDYKQELANKQETLNMLESDPEMSKIPEVQKEIQTLKNEIARIDKNIGISEANIEDIKILQSLEAKLNDPASDARIQELVDQGIKRDQAIKLQRLEIEEQIAEELGIDIDRIMKVETDLINRNIGAVDMIYNGFKRTSLDPQYESDWKRQIENEMINLLKTYDPSKGSVFNWLSVINLKWTQFENLIGGKNKNTYSLDLRDNEGNQMNLERAELAVNNTDEATNNITFIKTGSEKKISPQEQYSSWNGDSTSEMLNTEEGIKIKTKLASNAFMYFSKLNPQDYMTTNKDGNVVIDHKKMFTDFNKEATSPGNQNFFRQIITKPTAKKLGLNKDGTINENAPGRQEYREQLKPVYDWLLGFAYRSPQKLKNANWGNTGAATDWYTLTNKMSVSQSKAAGVGVKNPKAGNFDFVIKPPTFDAFMTMMMDIPLTKSNPNSALESKLVQVYNMMSFDFYQQRLGDYINGNGKPGSNYDVKTNTFLDFTNNTAVDYNNTNPFTEVSQVFSNLTPNPELIIPQSPTTQFSIINDPEARREAVDNVLELSDKYNIKSNVAIDGITTYYDIMGDPTLNESQRLNKIERLGKVGELAMEHEQFLLDKESELNKKAEVKTTFNPDAGDIATKLDFRNVKNKRENARFFVERNKPWGDVKVLSESGAPLVEVEFNSKEERDKALEFMLSERSKYERKYGLGKSEIVSSGNNKILFTQKPGKGGEKATKVLLTDLKNGESIKVVNPEIMEKHQNFSEELGQMMILGGDIKASHLLSGDYRQGIGRDDLYVWDAENNQIAKDADGNLLKYEKQINLNTKYKDNPDFFESKIPEEYKHLKGRAADLNSISEMEMINEFIQFNQLPTNAKGELSKKYVTEDGKLKFRGKEYGTTFEDKKKLYEETFTTEEEALRREIFIANYEIQRAWLNSVEKGSEEYNDRAEYLGYMFKEGSGLRYGWRNLAGFSADGSGGIMMYIPKGPIEKVPRGTTIEYSDGRQITTMNAKEASGGKIEHANQNVGVMNELLEGMYNNKSFEEHFGSNYEFRTMLADKNILEFVDQAKQLGTSDVQLKTGGAGINRFVVLNKSEIFVRDKNGKAISIAELQGRLLSESIKGINKDKKIEEVKERTDQELLQLPNLGYNPVATIKAVTLTTSNSDYNKPRKDVTTDKEIVGDGGIPNGQSGKTTNDNSNQFVGSGSTQFSINEGGDRLVPNQSGIFNSRKKVILTLGGPGSGKTTLLNAFLKDNNISADITQVNMDIFKESIQDQFPDLPSKESERTKEQQSLGGQIQALARKEKELLQKESIDKGDGMAIDMTGASLKSTNKLVDNLKANGYEVYVLNASVSKETSLARNKSRGERGERSLPDWVVSNTWESVNQNMPTYKDMFGENFFTVDVEQVPEGTIPKDVSQGLFDKMNANNVEQVVPIEQNKNIPPDIQFSLKDKTTEDAETINFIINRNISEVNKKPMSDAELKARQQKMRRRIRFQPNDYSHLDLLLSRFFTNRQDFEKIDELTVGQYVRDQTQFNIFRNKVMNDYKGFNKSFSKAAKEDPSLKFKMNDKAFGEFTNEQVIRAYAYLENGYKPEGLSDMDIANIYDHMNKNTGILTYANGLMNNVVSNDGGNKTYFKPSSEWIYGSIYSDLTYGINSSRNNYFQKSMENFELVFGNGNLDRMALQVNDKTWKQNVQSHWDNVSKGELSTYTDPRTRKAMAYAMGYGRLGLIGSFRSLISQLSSSTLFAGYGRGVNPFRFLKAFKEPSQNFEELKLYLKSPEFGQRGSNFDLSLAEIQSLETRWSQLKNKSASLSFALSSFGDKAAIALGAFYVLPQRINKLLKDNPEMSREEARKIAHAEFQDFVERTQQSIMSPLLGMGQRGIFGKLTTGFLNSPIRYNNRAFTAAQKAFMKDVETGKVDLKSSAKELATMANYMVAQGLFFGTLQQGIALTYQDDESEEKDALINKKQDAIIKNQYQTLINATGPTGKLMTSIYNTLDKYILQNPKQAKIDGVDMVFNFMREFSPVLGVRMDLVKSAAYDLKDIQKQNKETDDFNSKFSPFTQGKPEGQTDEDYMKNLMPYLRFASKIYALGTNQGGFKELTERWDDKEFIEAGIKQMDQEELENYIRITFWQMLNVVLGQSPFSENIEAAKKVKKGESLKKDGVSTFPESKPSDDIQYVPLGNEAEQKASPFD